MKKLVVFSHYYCQLQALEANTCKRCKYAVFFSPNKRIVNEQTKPPNT